MYAVLCTEIIDILVLSGGACKVHTRASLVQKYTVFEQKAVALSKY